MRELSLDNFQKEEELATFIPKPDVGFLVAQPLYFEDSILGQYATSHHRGDILDYAALAVELGVLSPESATKFFDAKHFIPGGIEFGIYPKDWLVQTLSKVELVSRKFLQRFGNRVRNYDTYQVRAVGFLSERLGSFLLLNHLVDQYSNTIPAEIFGYMTVITEGSCGYSVAATDRSKGLFNLASIRQKRIQ
ncbi:hypothetical protein MUNTM_52920 [Mycobacterium sp. MUNTM1]